MHSKQHFPNVIFGASLRPGGAALAIMLPLLFLIFVLLFMTLAAQPAQAQTFNVLYNFTGGADGGGPEAGLTLDQAGNLYGTAWGGGDNSDGTVFKLTHKNSAWIFSPLYAFAGGNDGANPGARVVFGPHGSLYGTTSAGGGDGNAGTVFNLKPYPTACKTGLCGWQETVLYRFTGGSDGASPGLGDLIFDQAGNLYSTTTYGGAYGQGTVFELAPNQGGWTESVLYNFTGGSDGGNPDAGLIFDNLGKLYGTTLVVGSDPLGTVFQLTPSGSGWTVNVLYTFQGQNDGAIPYGGLIFDQSGNLYGTAFWGGQGGGTVFKLTPSGGSWIYSVVHSFTGVGGPAAKVVMDGAGNLYGTTVYDGAYGGGNVFKLTPFHGYGWVYTSLHDFTGGSDGAYPVSNVTFDTNGNLYGTASAGGAQGVGVVWEIMP